MGMGMEDIKAERDMRFVCCRDERAAELFGKSFVE